VQVSWRHLVSASSALIIVVGVVIFLGSGSKETGSDPSDSKPPVAARQSDHPSFVRSGSSNIYVIDVAKRSLKQLTRNDDAQLASEPAWSASGPILFSEEYPEEEGRLFLVDPDGSRRRRVPTRVSDLFQPSWAPDGRKIVAMRLGSGIYVINTRTRSARRFNETSETDTAPAWSPDGKTIVFQRQVTATNLELYRMDATGHGRRRLTRDPLQQINPTWSPDGSRLAFAEQQRNGNWALSSMKVDGSNRRLLTDPRLSSQNPAWSPDGEKIAFVLQERSRDSIAVIDADGGRPVRITPRSLVGAGTPSWSPDSRKIAFAAHRAERPPPGP